MALLLPQFLVDLQELELLPEKIAMTVPSVFEENRIGRLLSALNALLVGTARVTPSLWWVTDGWFCNSADR